MELLTAAQMRAIEGAAITSGQVSGLTLMERAGRGVLDAIFETWPDLQSAPQSALILCGPGNNGGDGFVVARLLADWGWEVTVLCLGNPEKLPPDARQTHDRWIARGAVQDLTDPAALPETGPALILDALFGTGLTRAVELPTALAAWLRARRQDGAAAPKRVAVDLPSGLCSDSGRWILGPDGPPEAAMRADLTVSFHAEKLGHRLADGPQACGQVVVKDIGLGGHGAGTPAHRALAAFHGVAAAGPAVAAQLTRLVQGGGMAARLQKAPSLHKYGHGHAVVLSGPAGRSGAARLAARAALRVGAGLVTVAAPGAALQECAAQLTAIMLRRADGPDGLAALLEDPRLNALCLGPGLGGGADTRALVATALAPCPGAAKGRRAVVLDADALTAFAETPAALFRHLHPHVVLTPHGGEFARLFPDIAEKLAAAATAGPAYSKRDATREAAERAGCVVLFKGPDTVIAAPDGATAIHAARYDRPAPWLATAGSGDVLAGLICGLLARGLGPMSAAETAAWLHVAAARAFGPGLIAEDLPESLPQVLRDLLDAPGRDRG